MVDAIAEELRMRKEELKNEIVETVYFGGGTPSLLTASELKFLITTVQDNYKLNENLEMTLESNPDDINEESAMMWRNQGINRLSIGIQSFRQQDLDWMKRAHTAAESKNCLSLVKKIGFDNITADLIYGLPNLTLSEWDEQLSILIGTGVNHISAYCLTIEKKTELDFLVKNGELIPSNEDQQSDQFLHLVKRLKESGYNQYEISNFGKTGFESKHNSNYWKGVSYVGVGPSAHSFNGKSRSWNVANNSQYIEGIKQQQRNFENEVLSPENQFNELLLTGLRTSYGVDIVKLESLCSLSPNFYDKVEEFKLEEQLNLEENFIRLTEKGRLMADHIASSLFIIEHD